MKRQYLCFVTTIAMLLTVCLTLPSLTVRAEGEEYLIVPVEVKDVGGKLTDDATFLITLARESESDTVSPLPDKTTTTLKAGETDEFRWEPDVFTEPGNYLYTLTQEKATGDDNVITEEITYHVTVRVINGENGLIPTVEIRKNNQNGKVASALFSNNDKRARRPWQTGGQYYDDPSYGDLSGTDVLSNYVLRIISPGTGEAFPYVPLTLLGVAALLGAWGVGRRVKAGSARKDGDGQ